MGELLVFRHQRRRRDLRNHQSGIETRFLGEESRQAVAERGVDQKGDAALGNGADFAHRKRDLVGGKGDRFGMEIAARDDGIVRKHQRIVGDGVGFDRQGGCDGTQEVEAGAVDLWLAADAIGILHALVALDMALANRGASQQVP